MTEKMALPRLRQKEQATAIFMAGIESVAPGKCISRHLHLSGSLLAVGDATYDLAKTNRLFLVGIGKASAAMAEGVEALLGERIHDGVIITKYGHGTALQHCLVLEAGHPIPDDQGVAATAALLNLVASAGPDDLILCLISGGGSALSPAPVNGLSLADKQDTTRLLLACGATIHEINTIRKHLSRVKGGRLCQAAGGARIVSLILSDVIGDDLEIIASGLTSPDSGTFADCLAILDKYQLTKQIPGNVLNHLLAGAAGRVRETPKPGDPLFAKVQNHLVGTNMAALTASAAQATALGYTPLILTSSLQGEAREVAKVLSSIAREVRRSGHPLPPPACLLAGGETTVTLRGQGLGGRNMELALAAAEEIAGETGMMLLFAGSDGSDGPTDATGAFVDGSTSARAKALGLSPATCLAENNAYNFFLPLGDLLKTGPTRTNVMDLQIMLIDG